MTLDHLNERQRQLFLDKISPEPNSGCWLWTAGLYAAGYGQFGTDKKNMLAHRIAYEMFVGEIPAGLQLDHLCRVRSCVNPNHLEPVTNRTNTIRGMCPEVTRARAAARANYSCGHPITEENTWRSRTLCSRNGNYYPTRICRICGNVKQNLKRLRKREARLARSI